MRLLPWQPDSLPLSHLVPSGFKLTDKPRTPPRGLLPSPTPYGRGPSRGNVSLSGENSHPSFTVAFRAFILTPVIYTGIRVEGGVSYPGLRCPFGKPLLILRGRHPTPPTPPLPEAASCSQAFDRCNAARLPGPVCFQSEGSLLQRLKNLKTEMCHGLCMGWKRISIHEAEMRGE